MSNIRTLNMIGHELVTSKLVVSPSNAQLHIMISDNRISEMRAALNGYLNCRPEAPTWLFDLCDMCDAAKEVTS